jgi:hypothetical protein
MFSRRSTGVMPAVVGPSCSSKQGAFTFNGCMLAVLIAVHADAE